MNVGVSRREQRKAAVRHRLVAAADALFTEHGFEHTTVDRISATAGVSRRTFFRYFANKESIAFPHARERQALFVSRLMAHLQRVPAVPAVFKACCAVGCELTRAPHLELRRQAVIDSSPVLRAAELDVYREWERVLADGLACEDPSPARRQTIALFSAAMVGVARTIVRDWVDSGATRKLSTLGREAFGLISAGFAGRF